MFDISHNVPIPERGPSQGWGFTQTLREMHKGDSVEVPLAKKSSIYGAAHAAGVKVRARGSGYGTVRVWRIDGPERPVADTSALNPGAFDLSGGLDIFGQPIKKTLPEPTSKKDIFG
jgi:hypothetical protein